MRPKPIFGIQKEGTEHKVQTNINQKQSTMKTLDNIQQRFSRIANKQIRILQYPGSFYTYDDTMFFGHKRYIHQE